MPNWGYNYAYELYSIRDSVVTESGFCVSKLPNPDSLAIDNEEQCFGVQSTTITLSWNSVPGLPYHYHDYKYVLLRYNDDDECLAYMMKNTAVNRIGHEEWEATFHAVSPDMDILKAVLEYRNKTAYSKCFNSARHISKERSMFMDALRNTISPAFECGITNIPLIKDVFYNEPHTVVKWNDGTTTIVGCAEGEEFSKELGLSVAIAKKYFELLGFPYPRAALKKLAENGHDQTAKTKARKKFKDDKKAKAIATEE